MPPTPKSTSPTTRKRYCGLGNHHLRTPHKTISDEKILSFAKHINPELRSTTLLCGSCYDTLVKIYRVKLRHAIQLQKGKKRAAGNTNSISDVSSSQQVHSQSSSAVSAYSTISENSSKSTISDNQPTTSTSTTTKRKRVEQRPPDTDDDAIDDDEEPLLSLNAVNGTRLPNIQPIPKRRQFVHLNKDVMDIYLSGTTGG